MPIQAVMTLDGVAFNPAGVAGDVARWVDRSAGVATGWKNLDNSVVRTNNKERNFRVTWNIKAPVIATEGSECVCVGDTLRTDVVSVIGTFHPTSTLAERQNALDRLVALVATTAFQTSFLNLEGSW